MIASLAVSLWLGAVSVRVQPAVVTFGDRTAPHVEVSVVGKDGAPIDEVQVKLTASVGSLSPAKPAGPGRFQAQYALPAKHLPQMAIILVEVDGREVHEHAWLTLPLQARADLRIETKSRARLTVDVGQRSFGPVTADRSGHATVTALIPPCVDAARVHATDPAGNVSEKTLDLKPTPFPRALLHAGATSASWADRQPTPVEVYALDAACAPVRSASGVQLLASAGTVGAPAVRGPGLLLFPFRAPDEVGAGLAKLTVQTGPVASPQEASLRIVPGPQTGFSIRFQPAQFVAGSGARVRILTAAADGRGNIIAGGAQPERVRADFGTIEGAPPSLEMVLPDTFQGRRTSVIRGEGAAGVSQASLVLVPGPPSTVVFVSKPGFVRAGETFTADAQVTDAFGNAVTDAPVRASLAGGTSPTVEPLGDGRYRVTSAVLTDAAVGTSEISLDAGAASRREDLLLGPFQRPWGFLLGVSVTAQGNFVNARALVPRLNLGLHVGRSNFELLLEAEAGLYQSFTTSVAGGVGTLKTTLTTGAVALGGRYSLPIAARWAVYASGAFGGEAVPSTLLLTIGDSTRSQKGLSPAFFVRAALGASVALGQGRLFAQVEGSWAPARGQLTGNLGGLGVGLGYLYGF